VSDFSGVDTTNCTDWRIFDQQNCGIMTRRWTLSGTVIFLIHSSTTHLDDDNDISRFSAANQQNSTIHTGYGEEPACIGHFRGHGFIPLERSGSVFHASGDEICG